MLKTIRGVVASAFVLVAVVPVTLALTATSASADAQINVTTTADGGSGSLRDAFATADTNGVDTTIVLVAGSDYELTDCQTGGALSHAAANSITILGNGSTIRQTCTGERVITNVGSAGHLTVDGVWITGGNVSDITGGGGIGATTAGLTVVNSTISGNTAGSGGAVFVTGGGSIAVTNSTITGNIATSDTGGGGIDAQGDATLVYATVVGNTAGGSDEPANVSTGGDLTTFGSVVATPLGTDAVDCIVTGSTTSHGYNFSDDSSCAFTATGDHQAAGDPGLEPLADNGGGTPTMEPTSLTGPLVDAIPLAACQSDGASGITTDQRGSPRPGEDINACGVFPAHWCDIGAFEEHYFVVADCPGFSQPPPPIPPSVPPRFTG